MIKVSNYIAKRLKQVYDVNHFFMVSGGGAMHLNDSLGSQISYTANHHEQVCAIAAEGFARLEQKLAVVNVTTGPGGLNCLNGVFGQWTDSVPVLYVSGQVKHSTTMDSCPNIPLRQLGDQEVDIISVVKPLTKYAKMVVEPNEIKYHLDKAINIAKSGRPGPVWLDIPMNVQGALIDEDDLISYDENEDSEEFNATNEQIVQAIEKLKNAKRPLIVAGNGIRVSKSEKTFYQLLKKMNLPVVTTFNGFDLLDSACSNYVGRIGTVGQRAGNFALQNADLVLFLGTRNNIRQVSYNWENFASRAYKIVVDIDKAELDKPTILPDLKIHSDLKDFLPKLLGKIDYIDRPEWLSWCKEREEKYSFKNTTEYQQSGDLINPYYFVHQLTEQMKENDICVAANGSACVCLFQAGVVKKGQRIIWNSGNASMGYDLPAAIGACVASGYKDVVCLAGDGSIMMNLQELQTIKHNNLPIKIFIIANDGYASIKQTQKNFFDGRMVGSGGDSGVSVPDFAEVGKAFGIKTIKIDNSKELDSKIEETMKTTGPVVCEVIVNSDYSFSPKLSARKLDDGTMVSPSLEDMFPFLSREELMENAINE